MIEHLTQGLEMSMGLRSYPMEVSEEKAEKLKAFLYTDQAFTKNIRVGFVTTNAPLNHEDLDLAIDAFCAAFLSFEEYQLSNIAQEEPLPAHPYFGALTKNEWGLLHQKHIEHHFMQFGL